MLLMDFQSFIFFVSSSIFFPLNAALRLIFNTQTIMINILDTSDFQPIFEFITIICMFCIKISEICVSYIMKIDTN